jgi:hypothetical protein
MAPSMTVATGSHSPPAASSIQGTSRTRWKKSGALDAAFAFDELTPAIGREYPSVDIVRDLLNSPNADELLRELAITSM